MGRAFPITEVRLDRGPLIREVIALARGGWPVGFQNDVTEVAKFLVARAVALTQESVDCVISFDRVPLDDITGTNPRRVAVTSPGGYPILRERLESDPAYDSVPLSVGRSRGGTVLWDGHRRMETYRAAGRIDVPAWVATFRRGTGLVSVRQ